MAILMSCKSITCDSHLLDIITVIRVLSLLPWTLWFLRWWVDWWKLHGRGRNGHWGRWWHAPKERPLGKVTWWRLRSIHGKERQ